MTLTHNGLRMALTTKRPPDGVTRRTLRVASEDGTLNLTLPYDPDRGAYVTPWDTYLYVSHNTTIRDLCRMVVDDILLSC